MAFFSSTDLRSLLVLLVGRGRLSDADGILLLDPSGKTAGDGLDSLDATDEADSFAPKGVDVDVELTDELAPSGVDDPERRAARLGVDADGGSPLVNPAGNARLAGDGFGRSRYVDWVSLSAVFDATDLDETIEAGETTGSVEADWIDDCRRSTSFERRGMIAGGGMESRWEGLLRPFSPEKCD